MNLATGYGLQAWRRARRAMTLLAGVFGELSDQNAYARHLASHGRPHSAEEWRRFSDTKMKAKFGRPKCC